jgi:hypothetical protein
MRLRILVGGLAFFAIAVVLATAPLVAQGHSVSVWKPCTIVGTAGDDLLGGTPGPDVICGLGGNDTIGGNSGADIIRAVPGTTGSRETRAGTSSWARPELTGSGAATASTIT